MKFNFTKTEIEYIIDEAMLKDHELDLDKILIYRNKGYSRIKIADMLGISPECLDKRLKILKNRVMKVLK